ncbi:nitroreductase family protein [Bradyrhizobium liaoningense]|uniref:nitroreductase family protein n=1 Tax=Bradyrhizobium liaoningense TaxID=43992 RepID=UPI001BA72161|nr:nitroreductase family protein [Bradyrhizobium liaoningense]MBR0907841.1 nitroreductase family protein [Bradyrhizobium liaoningense]
MSSPAKCGSAFRQLFLRRTGLPKRSIHPNTITIQTCCQRDTESDDKNSVEVFYGALGNSPGDVEARANETAKNYAFCLIVTIDRRLEAGSWLDLGMLVGNLLLAAAGRGLQTCP